MKSILLMQEFICHTHISKLGQHIINKMSMQACVERDNFVHNNISVYHIFAEGFLNINPIVRSFYNKLEEGVNSFNEVGTQKTRRQIQSQRESSPHCI